MDDSTSWLWPGWIPNGRPSLITGPRSSEMTRVAFWLTTMTLRGGPCPDGAESDCLPGHENDPLSALKQASNVNTALTSSNVNTCANQFEYKGVRSPTPASVVTIPAQA